MLTRSVEVISVLSGAQFLGKEKKKALLFFTFCQCNVA